ncbi:MAG: DUF6249 domain-containing protein [Bacteroidales bacterium]
MTDFIMAPAIVGMCVFGFYKFSELLIHRKERLMMIDKLSDISAAGDVNLGKIFAANSNGSRFISLRVGSVFAGIGLGLLIGFFIAYATFGTDWMLRDDDYNYRIREMSSLIYGASTLICGGIALLICFLIEQKIRKN